MAINSLASDANNLAAQLAEKLPYSYGTATPSTTTDGFLWYDENDTPPTPKFWDGAAFQALTSGKILQVVRATATGSFSTSSTSAVDVTGMTVSITPTANDSSILLIVAGRADTFNSSSTAVYAELSITDSSNNPISGAQSVQIGSNAFTFSGTGNTLYGVTLFGWDTPATTSSVTYKMRARSALASTTFRMSNSATTGQMFAIEVSA